MAYFATGAAFTAALNKLPAATTGSYKAFDAFYYAQNYMGAYAGTLSPIEHFVQVGAARGYKPNSDFDPAYYQSKYADLKDLDAADLLYHYVASGLNEGRAGNATLAAVTWSEYLAAYPDVAKYVTDNLASFGGSTTNGAIAHYVKFGVAQGFTLPAKAVVQAASTFTLTTGADSGALFTGGAGNDTFNADTTTLGSLDVLDGGAGTDTLAVKDSASITSLGSATISGIETLTLNSTAGGVGALVTTAGAAVAQVVTITSGTPSASQKYDIQIGDQVYTTAAVSAATKAAADTAIKDVLTAHLGDGITITNTTDGTVVVTANVAGSPLPAIAASIAAATSSATGTVSVAATTANVLATSATAAKQVQTITLDATSVASTDTVTVSVAGRDYSKAASGSTDATLADDVAALLNLALGDDSATALFDTVTVTALTAGVPLPVINVATTGTHTDTFAQVSANRVVDTVGTTAAAIAAPTATTSATVTAGAGVVNVSVPATSTLSVTKGTSVQTSGGTDVTVAGATGSLSVTGATGVINVTTTNPSSTSTKVASNVGTGQTAATGTGIYVTGGTTVTVKQNGATTTSSSTSSTAYTNTINVGVNPTGAKDVGSSPFAGAVKSPTSTAYFNAVGGLAAAPTGDVTVNAFNNYTVGSGSTVGAAGKSSVAYAAATQNVFVNGATTVSLTGVGTGTVTDVKTTFVASSATDTTGAVAGESKLATVNLTGITGTTTIKSDAISTVNVKDASGSSAAVSVSNSGTTGVNAGAFNLNVGNSTVTVTNATATSVNVGSTAATTYATINGTAPVTNKSALTLNAVKATSLNLTNADAVTLTTGTAGLAKVATITASGAGNLTANITSATNYAKLVTVDASAKTGKVALTLNATASFPDSGQVIKTGSGADTVTLTGAIGSTNATLGGLVTTTIDLGAGNDALVKSGGSVATGAAIDAGAGTDTLDVTLITIGNAAIFKNFERLNLKSAEEGGSFDATLLENSSINGIKLSGDLATTGTTDTYAVTNLVGTTATVDVTASTAATVTATLATSTGTSDVMNINFASSTTLSSGTPTVTTITNVDVDGIKTTGIETVNVSSGGSVTNEVNFINQSLVINKLNLFTDTTNKTSSIVITGAKEFTLGTFTVSRDAATELTVDGATFAGGSDADGVYQNSTLDDLNTATADVQAGLTLIDASATTGGVNIWAGTSDALTGSWNQIYDGLTIKGGSGSDMIRNSAEEGVTTGGDGKDWLIVDGYMGSVDGGAGDDTLVASGDNVRATLTGGAGNDTFDVSTATLGGGSAITSTTTLKFVTITDFGAGDTLKLNDSTAASSAITDGRAAAAASTSATLYGATNAALGAATAADEAVWFTLSGATYVAVDKDGDAAFSDGDILVKLTGIHELTASTATTGLFGEA